MQPHPSCQNHGLKFTKYLSKVCHNSVQGRQHFQIQEGKPTISVYFFVFLFFFVFFEGVQLANLNQFILGLDFWLPQTMLRKSQRNIFWHVRTAENGLFYTIQMIHNSPNITWWMKVYNNLYMQMPFNRQPSPSMLGAYWIIIYHQVYARL